MEKHDVMIQGGDPSQHRSQGIVERFNRTLIVTENGFPDCRMLLVPKIMKRLG